MRAAYLVVGCVLGVVGLRGAPQPPGPPAPTGPLKVELVTNVPSPQKVGVPVMVMARLQNAVRASYLFRFSASEAGGPFHVVRDFNKDQGMVWMPALHEHEARVKVAVKKAGSAEMAEAEMPFAVAPRVEGDAAVVAGTANPLVALFSAPPCPAGSEFRVAFRKVGSDRLRRTGGQPCAASGSNNIYVAGMRPDSAYEMRAEVGGQPGSGAWVPFRTGVMDGFYPGVKVAIPRRNASETPKDDLTVYSLVEPWHSIATDQEGNVVWFLRGDTLFLTRIIPGGHILGFADATNSTNEMRRLQVFRELDLAGNTLRETNMGRVAEQLEKYGVHSECKQGGKECVAGFHHDALRLPNGHTVVLAGLERMMPAGTQGAKEPIDVLGDLIIDLDEDLQVDWVWNAFDHMDIKRAGLGKGTCAQGPGDDGCTPVFLAAKAQEWLHSNSLDYQPGTGSLLLSIPEQDWLVKVDFGNGKGSGKVLWRLGLDGDFRAKSDDPYPWFSYQHDAGFELDKPNRLLLYDDGHRRKDKFPTANNRGQLWEIDEAQKTATLVYNADVHVYSMAVGSAQRLADGGYAFEAGLIDPPAIYSRAVETGPDGAVRYAQDMPGVLAYRSFRVPDLYSAPVK